MPTADEYIMSEAAGDLELARLRANEAWMDEHTKAQLDGTGIGRGWRSLEVAAGAGSIVRWLGERVGPTGGVTAVDINTRFLTDLPDNVTIVEHDITGGPPETDAYDVVHTRSLLAHVPDPAGVLGHLHAAVRPGGWLVVEEGDLGVFQFSGTGHAEEATSAMLGGSRRLQELGYADTFIGRRLPGLVHALGLTDVTCSTITGTGRNGEPAFLTMSLGWPTSRDHASAFGIDERGVEVLDEAFADPNSHLVVMTVFSMRGRRRS